MPYTQVLSHHLWPRHSSVLLKGRDLSCMRSVEKWNKKMLLVVELII